MTTTTTTRTTTTTTRTRTRTRTRRRTRSNNNNDDNNDNDDDDNDDDDNEDAARSMSCPQVQMKSPSLFPSPDPYKHRRCAKLYNSAPPAPHEYADKCVTSVPERLELYGEARPKPPTLRRRAPKNTKNPSGGWGRAFWTESGSLISVSKSIIPPPPILRVPKIGKKRRFDTFFGRLFAFRKSQNAVNYSIFAF